MKLSCLIGLGIASASPVFAFPVGVGNEGKSLTPVVGCADFSGHWKGTCDIQGTVRPDEQIAAQDGCVALQLKNLRAPLGGTYTLVETYDSASGENKPFVSNTITSEWDPTRQIVRFSETVNNRGIGGLTGNRPAILTGEMRKVDGKLAIALFSAGKRVISCEYRSE
jgi:hypothetical protein